MPIKILRRPAVQEKTGLARSTLNSRISEGLWTKSVPLGGRAVGWPEDEVDALIAARICGKSNQQIKDLVKNLEASRKFAFDKLMSR